MRQTSVDQLARKAEAPGVNELAHAFLGEHQRPKPSALFFEESRRDPRTVERGPLHPLVALTVAPLLVEPAALAELQAGDRTTV